MITKRVLFLPLITLLILVNFKVLAVVPPTLNYQGHLTDDQGAPINGSANMVFAFYDVSSGGVALWAESHSVTVNQGVFSIELGTTMPFPLGLFERPLWLGLTVGSDAEMFPRRPVTSTGFAFKARDADTLEGISAATLDQSAHVGDTANPHSVTAAQVGAISGADLTLHESNADAHHTKTTSFTDLTDTATDAQVPDTITVNQATNADRVDSLHASRHPGKWSTAIA